MKDFLGVMCSGLCLIHCVALPVLAATGITLLGLSVLSGELTHLWLSVAMVTIALWAFPAAWRIHKHLLPGFLALAGSALMALAFIVPETLEAYCAGLSGVAFIVGHLKNRHLLRTAPS